MNSNAYTAQNKRGISRKLELIDYKGGRCEICGYCKNISALDFHHIDPTTKEFQLDIRHLSNTNIDKLKNEVDKCSLLCANCHREIHHPNNTIENCKLLLNNTNSNNIKVFGNKHKISVCAFCGNEFKYVKGKKYCSKECREMDKHYPTCEELYNKYNELKSWKKVADYFNISKKVINRIRNNTHNS